MSNANDPRDPTLETRVTFPKSWRQQESDALGSSNMFLSGLIIMTRNRLLAWPALVVGLNSYINQHPLRTKDGGAGSSSIFLAIFALIASYMPMILITVPKKSEIPLQN